MKACRFVIVTMLLFAAISVSAYASTVNYEIILKVDKVHPESPCGWVGFPCPDPYPTVGSIYHGFFSVEDSILSTDGENLSGILHEFRIEIAGYVWDMNAPWDGADPSGPNYFTDFRGPTLDLPMEVGAPSPGFDVHGGSITNLRGGVVGFGDITYIDFALGPNDPPNLFAAELVRVKVYGSLSVEPIPEPSTLALLGIGIVGLAAWCKKK